MMEKKKIKIRAFKIDEELDGTLERYANEHDVSISWIIRQALKHFLPMQYYNDSEGILRQVKK